MHRSLPTEVRRKVPKRRLRVELLESRQLLAAAPLGAMPYDTGEYMLGRIAVTPVLLESDGTLDPNLENWNLTEINQVLQNVASGMQWWVETLDNLDTVHDLEFVIDDTFAVNPVDTPYEPITRRSNDYSQYVGQFLVDQGFSQSGLSLDDAMREFNNSQREKLGTDWSFTIFIVDSSNDSDGMFDPTGTFRQAFAFAGGLFFITPSGRPASTYTHETGHMFWARDEYPNSASYYDRRGYYNTQNSNAIDDAPPGFRQEPSIMSAGLVLQEAYDNFTSPAATLAQIGWQDSDGDGIFDVLDVPLELDIAAVYESDTKILRASGIASAVALPNLNSSGLQNDITLNRISRIEYRISDGTSNTPWRTAASPDAQVAEVNLSLNLSGVLAQTTPAYIELRAIDAKTGVTSNIVRVSPERPSPGQTDGITGFAYVDNDADGIWETSDALLSGVYLTLTNTGQVYRGRVEPDDRAGTIYPNNLDGIAIRSFGNQVDGRVSAFSGTASTGASNFHYATVFGTWGDSWTRIKQELHITLDQPTTHASIVAIGKESESYGRLEGFDADGILVARVTSDPLGIGETATLQINDPEGRIASIKAYGTAGTAVSLDDFRYGPEISTTSNVFGTFELSGLPDGTYSATLEAPSSLYSIEEETVTVVVANGTADAITVRAERSVGRWTNPQNALDVNMRDGVQPLDALVIINELNRNKPRALTEVDPTPPYLDVNGDLSVTPIDALRIINHLNRGNVGAGEGELVGPFMQAADQIFRSRTAVDELVSRFSAEIDETRSAIRADSDVANRDLAVDSANAGLNSSIGATSDDEEPSTCFAWILGANGISLEPFA